jgi:hypothetical protein
VCYGCPLRRRVKCLSRVPPKMTQCHMNGHTVIIYDSRDRWNEGPFEAFMHHEDLLLACKNYNK